MSDITNQQLLDNLTSQLTDQFGSIADNMATKDDLRHQGILQEKIHDKVDTALELLQGGMVAKKKVKDHENRLSSLEKDNIVIKDTLKLHSRQLS